jgi:hypothetical protein
MGLSSIDDVDGRGAVGVQWVLENRLVEMGLVKSTRREIPRGAGIQLFQSCRPQAREFHQISKFQKGIFIMIVIKTGTFGQPELFYPKLTRHFLQYAQNTRRPTCVGVENGIFV